MKDFQFITNADPVYIEGLYNDYRKKPETVDPEYGKFFAGFDYASENGHGKAIGAEDLKKELGVFQLIRAYRKKGHLIADTNPIRQRKDRHANLDLKYFGLEEADLEKEFEAGSYIGLGAAPLSKIIEKLKKIYATHVGLEYSAINDPEKLEFLANAMENELQQPMKLEERRRILSKLNQGVMFEKFLHTKYVGQKRFSLEGGETTIPALDMIINYGGDNGVEEVVIGMAHRGRLNVLANTMGKTYEQIFI